MRWLIRLVYPRWFRERYGRDLAATVDDARTAASDKGPLARLSWWWRTTCDLVGSGVRLRLEPAPRDPSIEAVPRSLGDGLIQDVRFGLRTLARQPGFTAVAVLTLALGIGANAAIFSVVDAVLLDELPFPEPDRLVRVWPERPVSADLHDRLARGMESLSGLSGVAPAVLTLVEPDQSRELAAAQVTGNHFDVLRTGPALGRLLQPADSVPGAEPVAVLAHGTWRTRFGGDPAVVGRRVMLSGAGAEARTVVGVLPPRHECIAGDCEVWVPVVLDPNDAHRYTDDHFLRLVGRLAEDRNPGQATAELRTLLAGLYAERVSGVSETNARDAGVAPLLGSLVGTYRDRLVLLFSAVALVLLLACANVAHLLLARAGARQREVAIRVALGAGRLRLVRQLLTESLLLGVAGGAVGLLVARWSLALLVGQLPADMPRVAAVAIDSRVLLFTFGLSLLASLAFGLAPAWRTTAPRAEAALRSGTATADPGRRRFSLGLITVETAVAAMLLVAAGLLVRSVHAMQSVEPGFAVESVLTVRVRAPLARYPDPAQRLALFESVEERLRLVPGVRAVGGIQRLPLTRGNMGVGLLPRGRPEPTDGVYPTANYRIVTPGYFEALGLPVRGRAFTAADRPDGPGAGIVNASAAELLWPGEDAVGKQIQGNTPDEVWFEVVGVVPDVHQQALSERPRPEVYVPLAQEPQGALSFVLAMDGDPGPRVPAVLAALRGIDPQLPVTQVRTMSEVVAASLTHTRFVTRLFGLFAGLALTLGLIGVYGVMAHAVSERRKEMAVRVALGATRSALVGRVMAQGLRQVAMGVALGIALAVALRQAVAAHLYGVQPSDPLTLGGVAALLLVAAGAALCLPAWRASRVDPADTLRAE